MDGLCTLLPQAVTLLPRGVCLIFTFSLLAILFRPILLAINVSYDSLFQLVDVGHAGLYRTRTVRIKWEGRPHQLWDPVRDFGISDLYKLRSCVLFNATVCPVTLPYVGTIRYP